mgnify:FL=1
MKKLEECQDKLIKDRERWQTRLNSLDEQLAKSKSTIHDNKQYHRDFMIGMVDRFVSKEEEMQELITGLEEMNYELAQEVEIATKETQAAEKLRERWKSLSQKRQAKITAI